jgi:hypothetical protein
MSNSKKIVQAAAGNAGGAGLNVEEVFSTYLYDGDDGSNRDITNGIDLSTEGGMVWWRPRDNTDGWGLIDTERGAGKNLRTHGTFSEYTDNGLISAFNTDGYRIGGPGGSYINSSLNNYVSFSFRKAPKFFTCLTYTGTGDTTTQTISHDLGAVPGCIIVKRTDSSDSWRVYHRGVDVNGDSQPWTDMLTLNTTAAAIDYPVWGDTAPTSTEFTVGYESSVNGSGGTYVAYLFAHNDGDGDFGPDGDADIIKCGTFTTSSSAEFDVDLGFEPSFVLTKRTDSTGNWDMFDTMRGFPITTNGAKVLRANLTNIESTLGSVGVTSTGFKTYDTLTYPSNATYIYIAIRRGPMAVPESGTEVFEVFETTNTGTASTIGSMGPSDFILNKRTDAAATWRGIDRLRSGSMLRTDSNDTETSASNFLEWDKMGGVFVTTQGAPYITNDSQAHWLWKRAPGYFDAVAFSGDGVAGRTVSHNLGVVPEMIWVKSRSAGDNWYVYHKDLTSAAYALILNSTTAQLNAPTLWNSTTPTDSVFTVGSDGGINGSTKPFISYLFSSLDGISKVGSLTKTSSSLNVDCGFTSGARFVLIKRTDSTGDWWVFDTVRGINSGAVDPYLFINSDAAQGTNFNLLTPLPSGFTINSAFSAGSYIFYAIA